MRSVVSVWTRWGDYVIGLRDVRPGQALSVGSPPRLFVRFRRGVVRLYGSGLGDGRALRAGETVRLEQDGIQYCVTCSESEAAAMFPAPRRWLAPLGGAAAAGALALVLALLFLPRSRALEGTAAPGPILNPPQQGAVPAESRFVRVDAFAEAAQPQPQPLKPPGDMRCGDAEMGALVADTRGRYGLWGPKDNVDLHLTRPMDGLGYPTASSLTTQGDLGVARALPGTTGPTAPFGRATELGSDVVNAVGSMWGDEFAAEVGERGLGLAARDGGVVKRIDVAAVAAPAAPAAAPLRVLHTGLRVSGARKLSEVGRVMAMHFDDFRRCAEDAPVGEARRLDLAFEVAADGRTSTSRAGQNPLEECLHQSVARVEFAPGASAAARVVYPLHFVPATSELRMPSPQLQPTPPCDCGG